MPLCSVISLLLSSFVNNICDSVHCSSCTLHWLSTIDQYVQFLHFVARQRCEAHGDAIRFAALDPRKLGQPVYWINVKTSEGCQPANTVYLKLVPTVSNTDSNTLVLYYIDLTV